MNLHDQSSGIRALFDQPGLAELGTQSRDAAISVAEINSSFAKSASDDHKVELLRAAALLWNDHLDEAHRIVQEIEDADGSLLHAIMHRREPDYSNAKYWFRRVGRHPSFQKLARLASEIASNEPGLSSFGMIEGNNWNALAFVDACEAAGRGKLKAESVHALKRIQAAEMRCIVEGFLSS